MPVDFTSSDKPTDEKQGKYAACRLAHTNTHTRVCACIYTHVRACMQGFAPSSHIHDTHTLCDTPVCVCVHVCARVCVYKETIVEATANEPH